MKLLAGHLAFLAAVIVVAAAGVLWPALTGNPAFICFSAAAFILLATLAMPIAAAARGLWIGHPTALRGSKRLVSVLCLVPGIGAVRTVALALSGNPAVVGSFLVVAGMFAVLLGPRSVLLSKARAAEVQQFVSQSAALRR